MGSTAASYRLATAADMPGISRVRTSVVENHLSRAQLDARGITNEAVAASFEQSSRGWVALNDDEIVGFSIAEREQRTLFALFVLPIAEGRGVGTTLLKLATGWLFEHDTAPVWLTTGAGTRAVTFYRGRGWIDAGTEPDGQLRFELHQPMA